MNNQKWIVESGEMSVEVIANSCRESMQKAVFNFSGKLGAFISYCKIPFANKK